MPKTVHRKNAYAAKSMVGDPHGQNYNRSTQGRKSASGADPRNIVGDQGVAYLEQEGRGVIGPTAEQMTPSERKQKAAKLKQTVSDDMDEAIEMVRKKKSVSRNDY